MRCVPVVAAPVVWGLVVVATEGIVLEIERRKWRKIGCFIDEDW